MRKISWRMTIGFPGAARTGELEVGDDASDDEIDDAVWEAACQHVETTWEEVE